MKTLEWIRFMTGTGILLIGLGFFVMQVFGIFKFIFWRWSCLCLAH